MRIMMPNGKVVGPLDVEVRPAEFKEARPRHGPVVTLDQMPEEKVWEMIRLYGPISQK